VYRSGDAGEHLAAPLLHTDVELRVTGLVARARVTQRFANPTDLWLEGVYLFPLPELAAVDHLHMQIGERVVEGRIEERKRAEDRYRRARREGKKASLVAQQRANVFTTAVANIGPGEEVEVSIEYQETLRYDQGEVRLRFPMVVAPRYTPPGTDDGLRLALSGPLHGIAGGMPRSSPRGSGLPNPSESSTAAPNDPSLIADLPVSLVVELEAGFPVDRLSSPSHPVHVESVGEAAYRVAFSSPTYPANRDFVLQWAPAPEHDPTAVLFTEELDGEFYSLLLVLPPDEGEFARRVEREIVFVIDTSGSMGGASIRQARQALRMALERLRPDERFNVIEFNSSARKLFPRSVSADPGAVAHALRHVAGLDANGGTEMRAALEAALDLDSEVEGVRQVVFITDGSVGNEADLFAFIEEHLGRSRLFTVGIGSAPNGYFMKRAARFGRGTYTMIGSRDEVATRMGELFSKLERPALSDIEVHWNDAVEAWPARVPDLYQGEPVVVVARIPRFVGDVIVSGSLGGEFWERRLPLEPGAPQSGIEKLWARRKIAALMDSLSAGADREQVREDVVTVALQHHLVSKYTSLVAVDVTPTRPRSAPGASASVPRHLPDGWIAPGVLPATATATRLYACLAAACLFLAAALRRRAARAA
jgi:Ca-activated chloride channel family protein